MINLYLKQEENLIQQFSSQALLGRSKSIRKGYYFIEDVNYEVYEPAGEVATAKVNWNPSNINTLLQNTHFNICLDSLFNELSSGPKDITPNDLKGKFIFIKLIEQRIQHRFGRERKVLIANWEILEANPIFLNSQNIVLHDLAKGNRKATVREIWNNFVSTAPYDANGALNDEGYSDPLDYDGDYTEE